MENSFNFLLAQVVPTAIGMKSQIDRPGCFILFFVQNMLLLLDFTLAAYTCHFVRFIFLTNWACIHVGVVFNHKEP